MKTSNIENKQSGLAYQEAKEKVKTLKSFYFSVMIYGLVNAGLIYIWFKFSGTDFQWFWFPLIGWGLGLLFKGLAAYDINFIFGKKWEERKLKMFMNREELSLEKKTVQPQAYQEAKKKVDSIKGFYSHFLVYLIVNSFIVTTIVWNTNIDLLSFAALSTPFFWGIGLVSHAFGVFGDALFFNKDWENRKIKELMDSKFVNSNKV
ncbi:2TM domain-containing protein [Psychroflexus tropicus]|uniref:2TM domain-containing protein n=1 Tax=Psychroflexus tropicus TaxID=197345 RepID=UPI0003625620|nr:2TM domain-containing protein [Psychroflexus tropicus]